MLSTKLTEIKDILPYFVILISWGKISAGSSTAASAAVTRGDTCSDNQINLSASLHRTSSANVGKPKPAAHGTFKQIIAWLVQSKEGGVEEFPWADVGGFQHLTKLMI